MKMVYLQLLLTHALLVSSLAHQQPLNEQADNGPLTPKIDGFIEQFLKLYQVPSLSVAVVDKGKVFSKGYGISNFPDTKATPDTLYFTGSTTKAFTATAAGILIEDEDNYQNLTWTSRIHDFLPDDFVLSSSYETEHTTIEDALSHRSGLPRHDLAYGWRHATIEDTVRSMRYLPLTAEPRTRWQYCNLMFGAVGYLVESLTGSTLGDFLTDRVYKPLSMFNTFFTLEDVKDFLYKTPDQHLARGYFWHPDGFYIPESYIDIGPVAGAGATVSSVNDYAKWMKAWLSTAAAIKNGKKSESLITPSLLSMLQRPRAFVDNSVPPEVDRLGVLTPITYAQGWLGAETRELGFPGPSRQLRAHGGGLVGFGTELYMLLDEDWGIVTMGNTAGTSNIVGSIVFFLLYKGRFDGRSLEMQDFNQLMTEAEDWLSRTQHMRETSDMSPKNSIEQRYAKTFTSHPPTDQASRHVYDQSKSRPVSGVYSHPAYGHIIVTAETKEELALRVLPSARTWPWDVIIERNKTDAHGHISNFFEATIRFGSGFMRPDPTPGFNMSCGGDCRLGEYWQELNGPPIFAYFEPRGDGDGGVDRLGIELDVEMILVARADESDDGWRKGMIWFERIA